MPAAILFRLVAKYRHDVLLNRALGHSYRVLDRLGVRPPMRLDQHAVYAQHDGAAIFSVVKAVSNTAEVGAQPGCQEAL